MSEEEKFRRDRRVGDPNYVSSIERKFGQIGDFWNRYEKLADQSDKEMSKNLNGNLDVLLIFAGLFSAVNTAFISLSIPSLSPDSSDETNNLLRLLVLRVDNGTLSPTDLSPPFSPAPSSVIANCFLLSSLCFSLLAAVGAMLGKEWLQNYDRTAQPGLLEEQARQRQRKYDGAKRWHLEETVQFLPNILLFSVVLFFIGLVELLLPMNKVVAGFVISLFGAGTVLSLATIVAGTFSHDGPYQSAACRGIFWVGKAVATGFKMVKMFALLLPGLQFPRWQDIVNFAGASVHPTATVTLPIRVEEEDQIMSSLLGGADGEEMLNARAAHWTLQTTTNLDDQLVVAQNICNLAAKTCFIMAQDSNVWRYLLLVTSRALHRWHRQPEDAKKRTAAEQSGVALYHSLVGQSPRGAPWATIRLDLPSQMFHSHKHSLHALESIIRPPKYKVPLAHIASDSDFANLDFRLRKALIHDELLSSNKPLSFDLMAKFLSNAYDDGTLNMLAFHIAHHYNSQGRSGNAPLPMPVAGSVNWRVLLLEAYDGNNLDRNILNALNAGILVFDQSLGNWDGPAKTYTTFVRTMQNLATSNETDKLPLTNSLVKLLMKVQWKVPGGIDQTKLVGEILRTIKLSAIALDADSFQSVETEVSEALWHGLDHIVQLAAIKARAADINFEEAILDSVDLGSKSPRSNSLHAARIEDHPRVVAWLASKVGGFPSEARSWLKLMRAFETEWFGSKQSLQQVWIDHNLGWRLLGSFRTIKKGDELFLMSPILVKLISFETPKLRQHVVEAGLIPAVVDMVIQICRERERFDGARWHDGVNLVLEIFYQLWEFSERDRFVTNDKMVAAFKGILPLLESNLRPARDDREGVHSPLLAGYVQKHRGVSAIISHNGDVALNRLFAECDRKVDWGYHLYGQPKPPSCTRTDFASDGAF
ncbi:hypothetical protein FRC01_012461 [Tulasnella sp. 417]|nr:hypothetical protein FRC01_012461 [Tulasnella sp. 417]